MYNNRTKRNLARMIIRNTSERAMFRLKMEARRQKQSIETIAWRRAGNLLRIFGLRLGDAY